MMQKVDINLKETKPTIDLLVKVLSTEFVLATNVHNMHWNLVDPDFLPAHKHLGDVYETLVDFTDEQAERIRQLGAVTPASLSDFLKYSLVKEIDSKEISWKESVNVLIPDFEKAAKLLRLLTEKSLDTFKDAGTADMSTKWLEFHEKELWFLAASKG